MTLKKRLETFVQGWLPKESSLPVCQKEVNHTRWRPPRRYVLPLIIGAFVGGFLGAVGSFLNWTAWLGPYVWPVLVGFFIGIVSGVIVAQRKLKEEQQKSAEWEK